VSSVCVGFCYFGSPVFATLWLWLLIRFNLKSTENTISFPEPLSWLLHWGSQWRGKRKPCELTWKPSYTFENNVSCSSWSKSFSIENLTLCLSWLSCCRCLRSIERILCTSFFSPLGFTMSRGYWLRMPGHFRLWPPSWTDWHTCPRSHGDIEPIPDEMNFGCLKLLYCEFQKYVVTQPKKHTTPSYKATKHIDALISSLIGISL